MKIPNLQTRNWILGVIAAALTLFAAYGYVEADLVPLWLSLASHALGTSIAAALPGVRGSQERSDG